MDIKKWIKDKGLIDTLLVGSRTKPIYLDELLKEFKSDLDEENKSLQASIDKSKLLLADVSNCNYKEKYEKCINVIKRFDAGIISMYDL